MFLTRLSSLLSILPLLLSAVDPSPSPPNEVLFTTDFLFWGTGVEGSDLAVSGKRITIAANQRDLVGMDGKWEPGARISIGYRFGAWDAWELSSVWTYYHGRSGIVKAIPGAGAVMKQSWYSILGPDVLSAKGHWNFNLNVADLKLARTYSISRQIQAAPYVAARGAFVGLCLQGRYRSEWDTQDVNHNVTLFDGNTSFIGRSNYQAGGILGGTSLSWNFHPNWSLLGDLGVSLLYGQFQVKQKFNGLDLQPDAQSNPALVSLVTTYVGDPWRVRATVDFLLGLQWQKTIGCKHSRISLFTGYELYQWFGLNQLLFVSRSTDSYSINADLDALNYFFNIDSRNGDIGLQGLTARCSLEF